MSNLVRRPGRPRRAFTLIELMAVVVLMGVAVGVAVVRLDGLTQHGRLRAAVRQIGTTHASARLQAITTGQPRIVVYGLDADECSICRPVVEDGRWSWLKGNPVFLSNDVDVASVRIETDDSGGRSDDRERRITVRADGTSVSYVVLVRIADRCAAAIVDGSTGGCRAELDPPRTMIDDPSVLLESEP